jgi:hypothetical protein
VYNIALVRQLYQEITAEDDPQKSSELLALMQAVIKEEVEALANLKPQTKLTRRLGRPNPL